MSDLRFEWDARKAAANERRHGVSFEEAKTVFHDEHAIRAIPLHREAPRMRKEYDFTNARPNPYAKRLKKSVTIRLDEPTIAYFKKLASEVGIPYQTLINLYLRECAAERKKLAVRWTKRTSRAT